MTDTAFNAAGARSLSKRINAAADRASEAEDREWYEEEKAEARACGHEFPSFTEWRSRSGLDARQDDALFRADQDSNRED